MATAVRATRQNPAPPQPQVDLDFGSSKAISRKHCEIRFSVSRDRWELYVHSRNGIKLNHIMKKPRDKPNVLKTGALIEICNTSFIFFLPNNYIKPTEQGAKDCSGADTPENEADDSSLDHELEIALIQIFENHSCLDTTEILEKIKHSYTKPVEKVKQYDNHLNFSQLTFYYQENILHLLVLSPRFQLAPNSISMSSKDSDSVKWVLIPLTTNLIDNNIDMNLAGFGDDDMSINAPTPTNINTPTTAINTPILEKDKNQILSLDSADDMSIISASANGNDSNPFSVRSHSNHDDMSISTSANGLFPYVNSPNDLEIVPAVNISLSRFFDGEEGWSVFMPDVSFSQEINNSEAENVPNQSSVQTPMMFRAMSIESMYSVWSNGTSFAGDTVDDEARPSKRLKSIERDGDNISVDKNTSRRGM